MSAIEHSPTSHGTIWYRSVISSRCSIVTESVSPAFIFKIMGHKHFGLTTLTFQGHMTSSVTWIDWFAICHFLLVSHWNRVSIFNRFRYTRPQNPCARTHRQTDRHTPPVILYSVPCNVLRWTDKNNNSCWLMFLVDCFTVWSDIDAW